MSAKDLKGTPHKVRGRTDVWWYEENNGISVIVQTERGVKIVEIPWKSLRNALKRKDR